MAGFQTLGNNQSVFDPLLVFNEVREANSVYRFNFITAGEQSLRLTTEKRRNEKEAGAGWRLHRLLSNTLVSQTASSLYIRKARVLICSIIEFISSISDIKCSAFVAG